MRNLLIRLFLLTLLSIAFALFVPYLVAQAHPPAQGGPPQIPHAKEDRADCLSCHEKGLSGARKVPPDHTGRTNEMCTVCHTLKASAPGASATPAPTLVGTPRTIPHALEGRDQCLACHQTGVGGAPKVPSSHAGRTNDQCRTCHQPKVNPPEIVPTRIPHVPVVAGQNSCLECHAQQGGKSAEIVKQHMASIHAARGVGCVDCHGGDAAKKTKEEAMASSAGFVGKPKIQDIPALCASCHARVDLMRQYDIPTDQYAKYKESVHGEKLAQGNTNVATCFICHDQHGTKEVKDPTANVYPQNIPGLCGNCHANAQLMKPYGIPTNQYDLYKQSVHGIALLQKQDPRAPSCATCHGTHGAAPPGYSEVANVCGSCHSATQDYYLKSKHASSAPGTPKCVTCHGRYDVGPASEAMFTGAGTRDCGSCHTPTSPQSATVKQLYDAIAASAQAYDDATAAIKRAEGTGLIVAPEQAKLTQAKTDLITARAAQHTLSLDAVKEKTAKALTTAKEVQADAEEAISDSVVRRQMMVIGLGVMALAVTSLYLIRRELYRQLPPKE
jgi:hypothetical protein